ncbi:MAG: phage antirepressor KilAC domain-containing protein [Prevotella sp.]|jgi:prophage antirepressor-like protein|nr:phage antirepressor KilAC domain-containing protein [Prevotella sp.]
MEKRPIFKHPEFGEIRVLDRNGKPWFVAIDIARALGYKDPKNAIITHCNSGKVEKCHLPHKNGIGGTNLNIIPESEVYRLVMRSNLPFAEKFQDWVVEEVLPSIRKHGAYLTPEKTEELISNPDLIIGLAQALKTERAKVVEMQPKVEFAERIANYDDKIFDIGEAAKILKLSYGRNTLFGYLRELGIMMKNKNIPLQKYIDKGYFQVSIIEIPIGKSITYKPKVYITSKGLKWLEGKLKENNML